MRFSSFVTSTLLVAAGASERSTTPLADRDLPWDELRNQLSTEATLLATTNQNYFEDCYPEFQILPVSKRSNYRLIDAPSGICTDQIAPGFQTGNPMVSYDPDMTVYEIASKMTPSMGAVVAGKEPTTPEYDAAYLDVFMDPTNPAFNLPDFVLHPVAPGDVVAAVQFAKEHDIEISIKSSGHNYAGSSTKKNTLLLNMSRFRKYTDDGVVECNDESDSAPCKYALSRGMPGLIQVGGGQLNNDVYTKVKAVNEASPDGYKYHIAGAAAGTVSPMGWTMLGGLAGTTAGRRFGFGVDQPLQIEAVLPTGHHVRFGPTEWDTREGFRYPKVTKVTGVCIENSEELDESKWTSADCPDTINFDDLWFAFLGGGGGTYGILTKWYLQLPDYPGPMTNFPVSTSYLTEYCGVSQEDLEMGLDSEKWDFMIDFLFNPAALGIDDDDSNGCGAQRLSTVGFLRCFGDSSAKSFADAWKSHFMDLITTGFMNETGLPESNITTMAMCMQYNKTWPDFSTPILVPEGEEFAGRVDDIPNPEYTHQDGRYNVLFPKEWILENKERAIEILLETGGAPYIAFGGEATTAQDTDTVALSAAHRGAGMMIWLHGEDESLAPLLNDMYDMPASVTGNAAEDGDFPALTGVNHASSYMFGPLKEDTSKTCKIKEWTHAQATEKCVPVQYVLYGSKNVARLQAIKETIDPNYMLDCQSCIGTATLAKAELGPADGGSEAGETKPTDSGEASDCSYYSTLLCLQTSLCFCMVSIFFLLL
mmetsp:Transcript_45998/g.51895  ORF Transcript_45998/g.51895 Transcript_45998/m.51895 type:complete len:763 (-) Transcript_45998:286-2574(-)